MFRSIHCNYRKLSEIISKQGTTYALIVMLILATVVTISCRLEMDSAIDTFIARCGNMKEVLKSSWIGAAALWAWVIVWAFVGPLFF